MARRVLIWSVSGVIALAMLLAFVVPYLFPWSELNCRHEDVDITSGRLRAIQYLLFCKVWEQVKDSPLSSALPAELLANVKPKWERVNTFSPGVHHSPHYLFHSATYQIHKLSLLWDAHDLSGPVRQKTALHVLALWQHSQSDSLADCYLDELGELLDGEKRSQTIDTILHLEMPKIETAGTKSVHTMFYPSGQPMDRAEGYVAADGKFVRHGVWESWYANGKRRSYGHFENGKHHGRRFEWDFDGKLIVIERFTHDTLTEYKSENLESHPEYKTALELTTNPAH